MYQGFYNLTSAMLTQSRNLNVISNNMVNIQTAGYKKDTMVTSTFDEEMLYRTGRTDKSGKVALGVTSKIKTASNTYVDYEQGSFEQTDGIYDVALSGKGFFAIQTAGGVQYTRNGAFSVDEDGYLVLGDLGRVLSNKGTAIQITNENFGISAQGVVSVVENGKYKEFGTIKVVDFEDYEKLHKEDNGLISTEQAEQAATGTDIMWQMLERSNVDMVDEMTDMMSSQKALQSAAQVLKMYDQLMAKSSEIGKV